MRLMPMAEKLMPAMSAWRRALHRMPEEGLCEHGTQAYLLERLRALAPDALTPLADTGIKCVFQGREGGRALAFRADMDALSITEKTGLPFASRNEGVMHACGHDGHMAALLGLGCAVAAMRDEGLLCGSVTLLFQPAEESIGGAERMIAEGALENPHVDEVFGLHMMPDIELGKYGCCAGPMMASDYEFDIYLKGRSAHAAMPHKGINALDAANALYTRLKSLPQQCDPSELALFNIGRMEGGERRNIVPADAALECVVRTFTQELTGDLRDRAYQSCESIAKAYGVGVEMIDRVYYPAVINHEGLANEFARAMGEAALPQKPLLIAEDFSFYQQERPGLFLFVGTGDEAHTAPLHNAQFDFDDQALAYALQAHLTMLRRRMLPA